MRENGFLSVIDKNRENILNRWIDDKKSMEILGSHGVSLKIFKNHFATKILDYFVQIGNDKSKMGDCPAVGVMLMFFEHKNFKLDEVFHICDNFKKSVTIELLNNGALTNDAIQEVFEIFSANFANIIREFIEVNYIPNESKKIYNSIGASCAPDSSDENDLFLDFNNPIDDADTYDETAHAAIDQSDIDVIEELNEKLGCYIDMYHSGSVQESETEDFVDNLLKLGNRLEVLGVKKIGQQFCNLSLTLNQNSKIFEANFSLLIVPFESMLNDISMWEESIIAGKKSSQIENSIVANLQQIQAIIIWKARK